MADDDNFDIDIYGDDASPDVPDASIQGEVKAEDNNVMHTESHVDAPIDTMDESKPESSTPEIKLENPHNGAANGQSHQENGTQQISSTGGSTENQVPLPKQAPQQQGVKRKQGDDDDRPVEPGATAALMLNELNWWISEEDIRGWANQSGCEDELIDITFNEHKVNGKSKGQVYVHLQTAQAATALKRQVDVVYEDQAHAKKPSAIFNPPHVNPFKTLPKDVPARDKNRGDRSSSGNYGGNQGGGGGGSFNRYNNNNRGNFNNRGNQNNMGFQNRNFSGPAGGNLGGNMGGFNPNPMNNFGGGAMGMNNNFGGGFNRGGMMGGNMRGGMNNRGGRGGMMNNMGNMGMGQMGGNMGMMGGGMMGMGANMGMMGGMGGQGGFAGQQPHFNPAFFNQNQGGGDGNWNPHGAKRPRPE
ncbi:hypothetical protein K491DRAFT_703875 [Lophiostoma macrostomum CBS 122681]|uniref:RRM domain-containing protein n=1 Tax=Lophiostoma macrostomum CBS 122681 TaxID=1314788 RepID=A0A6A6TCU4_9PLEO|nr:hypothetical protein K491DRAFT_703875 [Lophiostoma macrostomum CBS 122681]